MTQGTATRRHGYSRYPASSLLICNAATVLHYLLGGAGIIVGYNASWFGLLLGALYITFVFGQMYVLMPLQVCPNCVYYRLKDSRCISGLNIVSRRVAKAGNIKEFSRRGEGLLCHNNLYMAAKVLPLVAMVPALIMNFSILLVVLFLAMMALLPFRILVLFPKVACVHCRARHICSNAQAMGLSES